VIRRDLAKRVLAAAGKYPVVTVTGPRQSGKTTLVRALFRDCPYVSLESPDERAFALEDPRGFLARFKGRVILDEAQKAPELFSYIQGLVDEEGRPGRFILSGSHNFLLIKGISQSLAGRCAILHLLPFSLPELLGRPGMPPERLGRDIPASPPRPGRSLAECLFTGFFPRIHDKHLPPREWLANYLQTYVERDVRSVLNIGDLESFGRFVRLCAGRSGQLLNMASLASDCGISHMTAKRWISVLEAGFIVFLLRPYHRNFGKRLIKAPKLYFIDTGLLSHLLGIRDGAELASHASRGAVFESFVVSELVKAHYNRGERPALYFWRDSNGREVDILVETGKGLVPIEVKSGQTVASDFLKGLEYWRGIRGKPEGPSALVYGGDTSFKRNGVAVYAWHTI